MNKADNGFFLSIVKSALGALRTQLAYNSADLHMPTVSAFADCYRTLFKSDDASQREDFLRARKNVEAADQTETDAFSAASLHDLLKRIPWRKAIGPDNLPADVFKCGPDEAAAMLQAFFRTLWVHQVLPTAWRGAFIIPIPKKDADLTDPAQWRGIALQSHTKILSENCVKVLLWKRCWTRANQRVEKEEGRN